MKKLFLLLSITSMVVLGCTAADSINDDDTNAGSDDSCKDVVLNAPDDYFGSVTSLTCNVSSGGETETVNTGKYFGNIKAELPAGVTLQNGSTTTTHFWFKGTSSAKLFKPVLYGRVFTFGNTAADSTFVNVNVKNQILGGNHDLHFDDGIFEGVHPYVTFSTSHNEFTSTGTAKKSSYNLEGEVKRSIPHDSWVVIQFIVQPTDGIQENPLLTNARYGYAIYKHDKGKPYKHIKVIFDDDALGYEGNSEYYQEGI